MKIGMDGNGNRVLKLTKHDVYRGNGFSIQVNGNLPNVERMFEPLSKDDKAQAMQDAKNYIAKYGTDHQKSKLDII